MSRELEISVLDLVGMRPGEAAGHAIARYPVRQPDMSAFEVDQTDAVIIRVGNKQRLFASDRMFGHHSGLRAAPLRTRAHSFQIPCRPVAR